MAYFEIIDVGVFLFICLIEEIRLFLLRTIVMSIYMFTLDKLFRLLRVM